jgi:hypothetical protein
MFQRFINHLIYKPFLEEVDFENLQKSMHANGNVPLLFDNRHQEVSADGDPDLSLDRVLRGAIKRVDLEVAFDPFEEQLDLPAAAINVGHRLGSEPEVVRDEDESFVEFGVEITDPTQRFGILLFGFGSGEHDDLIAPDAGGFIHG